MNGISYSWTLPVPDRAAVVPVALAGGVRMDDTTIVPPPSAPSLLAVKPTPGSDVVYVAVPLSLLASLARTAPDAAEPASTAPDPTRYRFDGWTLQVRDRSLVAPGGGVTRLRKAELRVLTALLDAAGRPVTREALAARLARSRRAPPSARAVDSYVCRLRSHFRRAAGISPIASVHAIGYRFDGEASRD